MKRILVIPKNESGIIDVRQVPLKIYENVKYLEEILNNLIKDGLNFAELKFCQFEQNEVIPIAFKIKDRISGSQMLEFEIEQVRFCEIDLPDVEELISDRYLKQKHMAQAELKGKVADLIIEERLLGATIDDDLKKLKTEFNKIGREIKSFDHKKYLNELI